MVTYTPEQTGIVDQIGRWIKSGEWSFLTTGAAGTGKSTISRAFQDEGVLFCSPTGKGAEAMRKRGGVPAQTVHQVLYRAKQGTDAKRQRLSEELLAASRAATPDQKLIAELRGQLHAERAKTSGIKWTVPKDAQVKTASLVVVDECFMLNRQIIEDLRAHASRVLFLGDPHQLPPVAGDCPLSRRTPDANLEQVHRQALENPVLWAATRVRQGLGLPTEDRVNDHGAYCYRAKPSLTTWEDYKAVDQIICGFNKTRRTMNARYRTLLGFPKQLTVGERVIFLKNDHEAGVYNGTIGDILRMYAGAGLSGLGWDIDIQSDGRDVPALSVWDGPMFGLDAQDGPKDLNSIDSAYAITTHKSQGSEWDRTLVYDEGFGKDQDTRRRSQYTALTRARTSCMMVKATAY